MLCQSHCRSVSTETGRLALWSKAKWPDSVSSFEDIFSSPISFVLPCKVKRKTLATKWDAPSKCFLKFNVDGYSKGNLGPAGVGGVLRDEEGSVKILFSKAVGVVDSITTEILAIKEAFLIFFCVKICQFS
ncbi:hypothetical protein REPUB_Repub16aG0118300 [Reevesia pubescens]